MLSAVTQHSTHSLLYKRPIHETYLRFSLNEDLGNNFLNIIVPTTLEYEKKVQLPEQEFIYHP